MNEHYYRLESGPYRGNLGAVLRVKGSKVEELTGFVTLKETGTTFAGKHYEINLAPDSRGIPLGVNEVNSQLTTDAIGLVVSKNSRIGVSKIPKTPFILERVSILEVTKKLEWIEQQRRFI